MRTQMQFQSMIPKYLQNISGKERADKVKDFRTLYNDMQYQG